MVPYTRHRRSRYSSYDRRALAVRLLGWRVLPMSMDSLTVGWRVITRSSRVRVRDPQFESHTRDMRTLGCDCRFPIRMLGRGVPVKRTPPSTRSFAEARAFG